MVKKKKESETSQQKQKSRAKYLCPPELAKLIYEVNLIPPGTLTTSFKGVLDRAYRSVGFDNPQRVAEQELGEQHPDILVYELLTKHKKYLPKDFWNYIENIAIKNSLGDENRFKREFLRQYIEYIEMRDSMLCLLKGLEMERQAMSNMERRHQFAAKTSYELFILLNWRSTPISITTVIKRDDGGKLRLTELAALIGNFDDSRLRKCEICKRIYWAKRENSKTCSARCLNVLNVRNSRALTNEEKAEKKAQREANRERNKKLKQLKEKKNGTL